MENQENKSFPPIDVVIEGNDGAPFKLTARVENNDELLSVISSAKTLQKELNS